MIKSVLKQNPWIAISFAQSIMGFYLINRYARALKRSQKCYEVAVYFAGLLDQNGIKIDEFDRIILQSIVEEGKEINATQG